MKKIITIFAATLLFTTWSTAQVQMRDHGGLQAKKAQPLSVNDDEEEEIDPLELYGIIVEQPEGQLKTFAREGKSWHVRGNKIVEDEQKDMTMQVVFADNGTDAYIQNPIAYVKAGTWMKGEIEGNTIKIPTGKYLTYNYRYEAAQQLFVMKEDETDTQYLVYVPDNSIDYIEYTIDGDNISLNMPDDKHILSAIWTDNNEWTGYGDFASTYQPFTLSAVAPPANASEMLFSVEGTDYYHTLMQTATVATSGNDVYIKGLCDLIPEGWIKGEKNGDLVTFEKQQFIGLTYGSAVYLLGSETGNNDNITDVVFFYDETDGSYSMVNTYMIINGNTLKFDDYDYYEQLVLKPTSETQIVNTIDDDNRQSSAIYNTMGISTTSLQKGINIVRKNGKTMKIATTK